VAGRPVDVVEAAPADVRAVGLHGELHLVAGGVGGLLVEVSLQAFERHGLGRVAAAREDEPRSFSNRAREVRSSWSWPAALPFLP
jgi:hypothetical protein